MPFRAVALRRTSTEKKSVAGRGLRPDAAGSGSGAGRRTGAGVREYGEQPKGVEATQDRGQERTRQRPIKDDYIALQSRISRAEGCNMRPDRCQPRTFILGISGSAGRKACAT